MRCVNLVARKNVQVNCYMNVTAVVGIGIGLVSQSRPTKRRRRGFMSALSAGAVLAVDRGP